MKTPGGPRELATLWDLSWDGDRVRCVIYRTPDGMELKVESDDAVMFAERFDLQPRALARANALRDAMKRRGWQDAESS
jgi:hypothetical protein